MPAASVDVATVRDRFNFEWTLDPENGAGTDTYWWWARSLRVDPSEVIADDGEGNLWSIPFTTDGEDTVTFGEPVRVRETFVPVAASDGAAATALVGRRRQRVLAAELERPQKPSRTDHPQARASVEPDNEETLMDQSVRQVLERQGLDPETATEDQINAASVFAAAGIEPPTPDAETDGAPAPVAETEPVPVAASADTVSVSRQVWEETNRRLERVETEAAARTERETRERRDALASQWVRDGRITTAEQTHYREMLDVDEDRTVALASALEPGRSIPTALSAAAVPADSDASADAQHEAYMAANFPAAARRRTTTTTGA